MTHAFPRWIRGWSAARAGAILLLAVIVPLDARWYAVRAVLGGALALAGAVLCAGRTLRVVSGLRALVGHALAGAGFVLTLSGQGGPAAILPAAAGYAILAVPLPARGDPMVRTALDIEASEWLYLLCAAALASLPGMPAWVLAGGVIGPAARGLAALAPLSRLRRAVMLRAGRLASAAVGLGWLLVWAWAVLDPGSRPDGIRAAGLVACALALLRATWEAAHPMGELWRILGPAPRRGLALSYATYHLVPDRRRRIRGAYGAFVGPGGLAFDIGSHLGNRIPPLLDLGTRVVAVEPQSRCHRLLVRWFEGAEGVTLLRAALGPTPGEMELRVSSLHPTLATLSDTWIREVSAGPQFAAVRWDASESVPVHTLDGLIERYGVPDFVKLDVEGYEPQVLAGLGRPLAALSFEYLPASIDGALACIRRLAELGRYRYNASRVESMRLSFRTWLEPGEMGEYLRSLPNPGSSGDVYAVLDGGDLERPIA